LSLLDICRFIAGEHCAFQVLRLIPGVLVEDGGPISYDESTKNLIHDSAGLELFLYSRFLTLLYSMVLCDSLAGLFGSTLNMVFQAILYRFPLASCRAQGLFTSCTMASARLFLASERRERCEGMSVHSSVVP
jgi:hypothetical protein